MNLSLLFFDVLNLGDLGDVGVCVVFGVVLLCVNCGACVLFYVLNFKSGGMF